MEELFKKIPTVTEEKWKEDFILTDMHLPKLSPNWGDVSPDKHSELYGLKMFKHQINGLGVCFSVSVHEDGKRWIHVSASKKRQIPTYDELCFVKKEFIGENRKAIQIFAKLDEHINIHPNCFHLWSCLDNDGLPNFGKDGMI